MIVHDNASFYKTEEVRKFFVDNNLEELQHPPHSPDLNPIENLWAIVKNAVNKAYAEQAQDVGALFKRMWNEGNFEACQNSVFSMPRRLDAVIAGDGKKTKY